MGDTNTYSLPLDSILLDGRLLTDPVASQAAMRNSYRRLEEGIAECMHGQGFEYWPKDRDDTPTPTGNPIGGGMTRKDYVEKYGFGIVAEVESQQGRQTEQAPPDPNERYIAALPEAGQAKYFLALNGDAGAPAADAPQGCVGVGWRRMLGRPSASADESFYAEMEKRLTALFATISADSRVVTASREYARCMAAAGYSDVSTQQGAADKVREMVNELGRSENVRDADTSGRTEAAQAVGESIPAGRLAEIQRIEISIAKADLVCGRDLIRTTYEVGSELQARFLEANQADLERFRDISR